MTRGAYHSIWIVWHHAHHRRPTNIFSFLGLRWRSAALSLAPTLLAKSLWCFDNVVYWMRSDSTRCIDCVHDFPSVLRNARHRRITIRALQLQMIGGKLTRVMGRNYVVIGRTMRSAPLPDFQHIQAIMKVKAAAVHMTITPSYSTRSKNRRDLRLQSLVGGLCAGRNRWYGRSGH